MLVTVSEQGYKELNMYSHSVILHLQLGERKGHAPHHCTCDWSFRDRCSGCFRDTDPGTPRGELGARCKFQRKPLKIVKGISGRGGHITKARDPTAYSWANMSSLGLGVSVREEVMAEKAGNLGIDQVMKDHVYLPRHLGFIQNVRKHLWTMERNDMTCENFRKNALDEVGRKVWRESYCN